MSLEKNKFQAVILDRDGTIVEEMGYINHLERVKLLPSSAPAIKLFNNANWKVIVVTNQAGVARGYCSEDLVIQANQKMQESLALEGAYLDGIYYCPHHEAGKVKEYAIACNCCKPKLGLLELARKDHDLNLSKCVVIGDRETDLELARNVGAFSVLVKTGYGAGLIRYYSHLWEYLPDLVAEDLLEAAKILLKIK